jgi:hypothetical protein
MTVLRTYDFIGENGKYTRCVDKYFGASHLGCLGKFLCYRDFAASPLKTSHGVAAGNITPRCR